MGGHSALRGLPSVRGDAAVALPDGEGQLAREVQRCRLWVQRPARVQGAGAEPGGGQRWQLGARRAPLGQRGLHHGCRLRPAAEQARGGLQAVPLGRRGAVVLEPHRLHLLQ